MMIERVLLGDVAIDVTPRRLTAVLNFRKREKYSSADHLAGKQQALTV